MWTRVRGSQPSVGCRLVTQLDLPDDKPDPMKNSAHGIIVWLDTLVSDGLETMPASLERARHLEEMD